MSGIISFSERASAPSSPAAGKWNIYSTSDGFSIQDSTGGTGLLPILSGNATDFLNGTGAWSEPGGSSTDLTNHTHSSTDEGGLIRLDTITAPTDSTSLDSSTDMHGLLPKLNGTSDNYFNGIGEWASIVAGGTTDHSALGNLTYATAGHTGFQPTISLPGTSDTYYNGDGEFVQPKLDSLAAPTDVTTLNSSTDAHGLLIKLDGTATNYLTGAGAWAVPVGTLWEHNHSSSGSTDGGTIRLDTILSPTDSTSLDSSTDMHGLLPKLDGTITNYFNGTGAWSTPAGGSGGGKYPMNGRLTLLSGTPVTTSDYATTDATTLYLTSYMGDEIGLHDGSTDTTAWTTYSLSNEPHIHLDATTDYTSSDNFDIWAYPTTDSVVELASTKWTNDTTRATALTTVAGAYCKTAATNYRYIGTIRMLAEGQTEDSVLRRFVWNYYNRTQRYLFLYNATGHSYNVGTWRKWNASDASNILLSVIGVAEDGLILTSTTKGSTGANTICWVNGAEFQPIAQYVNSSTSLISAGIAGQFFPISGLNTIQMYEYGDGSSVFTWMNISSSFIG
jgi:hypothetical protein